MRILLLANSHPWLKTNGLHLRLRSVLAALARLGDVDVFSLVEERFLGESLVAPPGPMRRIEVVGVPTRPDPALEDHRFLPGELPTVFRRRDYTRAKQVFQAWADCAYDLAWFHRADTYFALGPEVHAPAVVDFDDLEDVKILRALRAGSLYGQRLPARRQACLAALELLRQAAAWHRLQQRIAREVPTVVVTSTVDRRRLGAGNVEVVPNTYSPPTPCTRRHPWHPTLTFQGDMTYAPNAEACHELTTSIAPLVRAEVPELQVRLVGEADERVHALADPPRVIVTGAVEDMSAELCATDVVVVPLRYASGTRTKILEAFAHERAVVSASIGAEGIEATSGRHLLIRDRVRDIAAACVYLLRHEPTRARLAARGRELYLHSYLPELASRRIAAIARAVTGG
ncbi:MAG: glycosyltransferase family 4 protein [Actinomycetota bacterium]|nr:glycosyltransferase family 4 protein [Actinomycetota bacterium]